MFRSPSRHSAHASLPLLSALILLAITSALQAQATTGRATRSLLSDNWSTPELAPSPISNTQTIQPFIHSHGKTETLFSCGR
jgi:hypothetical protein